MPAEGASANKRWSNVHKARLRADRASVFFGGSEALLEVAKDRGQWNWALVGPDPKLLSLSGGGSGGVEEMREAVDNHAHSFGLLRITFSESNEVGRGRSESEYSSISGVQDRTRLVFVHVSDGKDSGSFSEGQRVEAMASEPLMEEAIGDLVSFWWAKVSVRSKEDCTAKYFAQELRRVLNGTDIELITEGALMTATMSKVEDELSIPRITKYVKELQPKRPQAAAPELDQSEEEQVAATSTKLRKKTKLFAPGDMVEVFSPGQAKWFIDGEVKDVVKEALLIDGFRVRAGSMKVTYDQGQRVKWVPPDQMGQLIRTSPRPKAPQSKLGELQKESHSWFITHWTKLYFELNGGFLQWWDTKDDAAKIKDPSGSVYLLGLQANQSGASWQVRVHSTQGAIHALRTESASEATQWVEALWEHAGYCEDVREFYETKQGFIDVRKELLSVMTRKRVAKRQDTIITGASVPGGVARLTTQTRPVGMDRSIRF